MPNGYDVSGVATVLEIFRVMMEADVQPSRTVEFFTYAAEEMGLLGSQDIAAMYKKNQVPVVAALQFDMTMVPGPSTQVNFITDYTDAAMTQELIELNDLYVRAPWSKTECGYGCSDHASWNRAGYRSGFPFESAFDELNQKIHTASDTTQTVSVDFGSSFAKLGLAYLLEVGGIE
jgi:leucyl aminopeptidase